MAKTSARIDAALKELRAFGLAFPGTHTKSPWPGHLDLAVKDKTFAYLSIEGEPFSISCKLPQSHAEALWLPFAKPTAYGLWQTRIRARPASPSVQLLPAGLAPPRPCAGKLCPYVGR
jgi:hypothetical protein